MYDLDEDDYDDDEIQIVICELRMNHLRMTYIGWYENC